MEKNSYFAKIYYIENCKATIIMTAYISFTKDGSHFNLIKNGYMNINVHFENALDHKMSFVVFAIQNIIEIHKS